MTVVDATTLTLAQAAAALHGLSLSSTAMAARVAQAQALSGGAQALVDSHLTDTFGALAPKDLARLVVGNLGLPASVAEGAAAYLQQQIATVPSPGRAVVQALDLLPTLTSDPVYGPGALAYNTRLQAALDRLTTGAEADAAFAGELTWAAAAGVARENLPAVAGVQGLVLVGPRAPASVSAAALPGLVRVEVLEAGAALSLHHLAVTGPTEDLAFRLTGTAAGVAVDIRLTDLRDQGRHGSSLVLELMDTRAATSANPREAAAPLLNSPFNGFSFQLNGRTVVLEDRPEAQVDDPATFNGAQTYPQLLAAVQALLARPDLLAQHPELKGFGASLGPAFEVRDSLTGLTAIGQALVLTGPNDASVTLSPGNFVARDGVASLPLHTVQRVERADDTDLVTTRVTLDDVGPDGAAGRLTIGLDEGVTGAAAVGVQRVHLTVERASAFSQLATTGNALLEVVGQGQQGGLQVLGADGAVGWRAGAAGADDFGFTDLRTVDLAALAAPVSFDLRLSEAAVDRLQRNDGQPVDLAYRGGSADDHLALLVHPALLADNGEDPPFVVRLDGGAGDDRLDVRFGDLLGAVADRGELRGGTVLVDGGAGDDHLALGPVRGQRGVVFEPGFGRDEVQGFDVRTDHLDLRALGGQGSLTVLSAEPAARSLALQAGAIVGGPEGAATDTASEVAALFRRDEPMPTTAALVYIAVDADNVGHVYRVEAGGAEGVSASLMGSIDLMDTPWVTLTQANFS